MSRNGKNRKSPRAKQVQKAVQRQQEKERARVAGHLLKLSQLEGGDKNPHIQQINQQLSQLADAHDNLATAYNNNWQGFANSLQLLDARVGAIMLVLDDIVRDGIQEVTKLDAEGLGLHSAAQAPQLGGVHWPGYIHTYVKKVEAELAKLKEAHAAAAPPEGSDEPQTAPFDPLITPEMDDTPEDEVVFGGKEDNGQVGTRLEAGAPG